MCNLDSKLLIFSYKFSISYFISLEVNPGSLSIPRTLSFDYLNGDFFGLVLSNIELVAELLSL